MKKKGIAVAVIILAALGVGLYMTRPVTPTLPASSAVTGLEGEAGKRVVVSIIPAESSVTYEIDEILRGSPKHVVGVTSDVAGDIALTNGEAQPLRIGDLAINARTLKTDDERRDGAVARLILQSEQEANQFITFKNVTMQEFSGEMVEGVPYAFKARGDLTIAGVTMPTTFAVTATLLPENRLTATATTVVKRSDFKLVVPSLSFLADVKDEVTLTAKLVAAK